MPNFNRIKLVFCVAFLLLASGLMFQFLAGCGGDDPVNPVVVAQSEEGVPSKPTMTDPDKDPDSRSESYFVYKPTPGFYPAVGQAYGDVKVKGRAFFFVLGFDWCWGPWNNNVFKGTGWTDNLPSVTAKFDGCDLIPGYTRDNLNISMPMIPDGKRVWLVQDGELIASPDSISWDGGATVFCRQRVLGECVSSATVSLGYGFKGKKLSSIPMIARERFWQLTPWQSGNLVEGIEGAGSIEGTSSYLAGSSLSETQSMSITLTSEGGADFMGLSAKVSASISQTFSSTVTFTESETQAFSRTLEGEAGKRNIFVLYVLKERYSFVNADGSPYSDQNYHFPETQKDPLTGRPYMFEISGVRAEAVVYHFDLKSNKMLGMETLP